MQVKPLALLIATLVSAPAFAENWTDIFKLSGSAEANYVVTDNGTTTSSELDRALLLNIDASKKIGGDLTLGGRISQKVNHGDTANKSVGFGSREAYVTLSGDFGTVKAGRQFSNSYLTQDWPFGQVGFWQVAEGGTGKVTGAVYIKNGLGYQSPSFGGFAFSAQHGWDNSKHNKDSIFDLAATLSVGKGTIYAGVLGSKPVSKSSDTVLTVSGGVGSTVTSTTTETVSTKKNAQQYVGARFPVSDNLTLQALYQTYKQDDNGKVATTGSTSVTTAAAGQVNKGKEISLGMTLTMGNAGYIKAAALRQDNTGTASDFSRYAVQYGRDIGGGAEWYARLTKVAPKDSGSKDTNQFLTGVWIGF